MNDFRPRRPDPERRKCARCKRTFYKNFVPKPTVGGMYDGALICRDCRHDLEEQARRPADTPGLF